MADRYVKFCSICNETKQNMDWCDNDKYKEFSKGYHFVFKPKDDMKICPSCKKGKLVDSSLTFEEFELIDDVSNSNREFLETMINLKQSNLIEYQLKLNQFKLQQEQSDAIRKQERESNKLHCPMCNSTKVKKISGTAKVAGAAMFGLFSKTARSQFKCENCGYKW